MKHLSEIGQLTRKQLEAAFCIAVGRLSTYGDNATREMHELVQEIIDQGKAMVDEK